MNLAGFPLEVINSLTPEEKVELTTGIELGVTFVTAKAEDSVTNTYSDWSSTLSYTRKTVNRYLFSNIANNVAAPFTWGQSIAVQGFAMEENTFKFSYDYDILNLADLSVGQHISGTYNNRDDGFDSITDVASGTGVTYKFKFTPLGITTVNGIFKMECYGTNSNVNEPAPGSIGGAFNVYGNVVLISGLLPSISISYPWGISVSGIASEGIPCKTTLTAVLYRE